MPIRPQPETSLRPAAIIARRPAPAGKTVVAAHASSLPAVSASSVAASRALPVTTIAAASKQVLTILSWNIQKFENTKALANPFVNRVIADLLAELDVDVCLLLETREYNADNLAAIEHRVANPTDYVESDEDTAASAAATTAANARVLTWQAIATELTGKRYKPPYKIYLYGNPAAKPDRNKSFSFPTMLKSLSVTTGPGKKVTMNGAWRDFFDGSEVLKNYYDPWRIKEKTRIANSEELKKTDEHNVVFKLKTCLGCEKWLGSNADCDDCAHSNPYSDSIENLRKEIQTCAFSLGGPDLESYAVLVRPHAERSFGAIQLKGKAATVNRLGCALLRHAPPTPYTPTERRDAFLRGSNVPPDAPAWDQLAAMVKELRDRGINPSDAAAMGGAPDPDPKFKEKFTNLLYGQGANEKDNAAKWVLELPMDKVYGRVLDWLEFPVCPSAGARLPYLTPGASAYGRTPFVLPMAAKLTGANAMTSFPVVAFHAPFGDDMKVRVSAMTEILKADPGNGTPMSEQDNAIIMGDFNLDLRESAANKKGKAADEVYTALETAGFASAIPKVASSLKGVYNTAKKANADSHYKKYENVAYQHLSASATTAAMTSSAYDNILVRGAALQEQVVTAAVVDVIGWIADRIEQRDIELAATVWPDVAKLDSPLKQAFFIYHVFVSDHLPVLLDIEVDALPEDFDATSDALQAYRTRMMQSEIVRHTDFEVERVVTMAPFDGAKLAPIVADDASVYIGFLSAQSKDSITVRNENGSHVLALRADAIRGDIDVSTLVAALIHKPKKENNYVYSLTDLKAHPEYMTILKPPSDLVFLIGTVKTVSKDGKRIRIQVDRYRGILTVPEGSEAPAVNSLVAVLVEGFVTPEAGGGGGGAAASSSSASSTRPATAAADKQ